MIRLAHSTLLEMLRRTIRDCSTDGLGAGAPGMQYRSRADRPEGHKAIDVFYLTAQGKKLTTQKQELLREVLQGLSFSRHSVH